MVFLSTCRCVKYVCRESNRLHCLLQISLEYRSASYPPIPPPCLIFSLHHFAFITTTTCVLCPQVERDVYRTRLLQCKGKRTVRATEKPCEAASLNKGDVFILDMGLELFV